MGIFDGILLCTDLDDTLLSTDKSVSEENLKAIEYFKKEVTSFKAFCKLNNLEEPKRVIRR
jgi:hypothetical protein